MQACPGTGQCPATSAVTPANFQVTDCSATTATVTFKSTLLSGTCGTTSLGYITLAAIAPGAKASNRCTKGSGEASTYGGVVTLTGVRCDSRVLVYAHDASYASPRRVRLSGVVPVRCREGSRTGNCGAYGDFVVDCGACNVRPKSLRRMLQ